MITLENPAVARWASTRVPVYLRGTFPKFHYTWIYAGGKKVGRVQDGVFSKRILASKHTYHKRLGFCFDIESLKKAERAEAHIVEITDLETWTVYRAAISTIWNQGFYLPDFGYGKQIGLDMHLWSRGNEPVYEQIDLGL